VTDGATHESLVKLAAAWLRAHIKCPVVVEE